MIRGIFPSSHTLGPNNRLIGISYDRELSREDCVQSDTLNNRTVCSAACDYLRGRLFRQVLARTGGKARIQFRVTETGCICCQARDPRREERLVREKQVSRLRSKLIPEHSILQGTKLRRCSRRLTTPNRILLEDLWGRI